MTTERGKYGLQFICDQCDERLDSDTKIFGEALDTAKEQGWIVMNSGGQWRHFCTKGCKSKYLDNI